MDALEVPAVEPRTMVPFGQLFHARELRHPFLAVGFMIISQQISGMSSVTY